MLAASDATTTWWAALGGGLLGAFVTNLVGLFGARKQRQHDTAERERERHHETRTRQDDRGHDALMRARERANPLVVENYTRMLNFVTRIEEHILATAPRFRFDATEVDPTVPTVEEQWRLESAVQTAAFATETVRHAFADFSRSARQFYFQEPQVRLARENPGDTSDVKRQLAELEEIRQKHTDGAATVRSLINAELRADSKSFAT